MGNGGGAFNLQPFMRFYDRRVVKSAILRQNTYRVVCVCASRNKIKADGLHKLYGDIYIIANIITSRPH